MAQIDLIKYFGGNGKIDELEEAELARCIIQSQISTFQALREVAFCQHALGDEMCKELKILLRRKAIAKDLSDFVLGAHHDGAITASEAHTILHPMNHIIAESMVMLEKRSEGVLDSVPVSSYSSHSDLAMKPRRSSLRASIVAAVFGGSSNKSQENISQQEAEPLSRDSSVAAAVEENDDKLSPVVAAAHNQAAGSCGMEDLHGVVPGAISDNG
jgi:hypothetical protein